MGCDWNLISKVWHAMLDFIYAREIAVLEYKELLKQAWYLHCCSGLIHQMYHKISVISTSGFFFELADQMSAYNCGLLVFMGCYKHM